jgi:hypothetical protein
MNDSENEETLANEQFATQAKAYFDDSVQRLDAATLSRLNKGRHQALAHQGRARPVSWFRWMPATGIAAAVLVTMIVIRGPAGGDVIPAPMTASDLEILLEEDGLELFEDLEFYSWLEAADFETNGNVG